MKKLLVIILGFFAILSIGCGRSQQPDNEIYQERSESFTWQVVEPGKSPVKVFQKEVMIKPTRGQSNVYASERKDFILWQVVGWVALLALIFVFWARGTTQNWFPNIGTLALALLIFALASISLVSFKWQSQSILLNNDKWVKKEVYEKAVKETGSTKPIWDSLRNECRIVFGPYECFDKK